MNSRLHPRAKNNLAELLDPLNLAILLSLITLFLSWFYGPNTSTGLKGLTDVFGFWEKGFWDLLSFSMQMVLILFLGHMLALSPLFDRLSSVFSHISRRPVSAVLVVAFSAVVLGLLNWGLALVFTSVLVRKIGESAYANKQKINYPLLGGTAYVCMMVWHGGLSGSAPLSVADPGHFLFDKTGTIPLTATLFSDMNIVAVILLLLFIPATAWWLQKRSKNSLPDAALFQTPQTLNQSTEPKEKRSFRPNIISLFGLLLLLAIVVNKSLNHTWSKLGLNDVNLILFALVFIFSGKMKLFHRASGTAIASTVGIVIQFPLYAGIMGMVAYSGLLEVLTLKFSSIATPASFGAITFTSAAIVNFFVPSGGGQWVIQGPIIMQAAQMIQVPFGKAVMALAWGDQLSNMLQPFWALPLLGITGLKAIQVVRYSAVYILVGIGIFVALLTFM